MRRFRRIAGRILLVAVVVIAVTLVFRQGLVPAHLTPLPRLDLNHPLPLITDWQLAELRYDRRLCRDMLKTSGGIIDAHRITDKPLRKGCGWINAVTLKAAGGAHLRAARLTCQTAAAVALWMQNVVQPAAEQFFGHPVTNVDSYGTYACRNIVGNSLWSDRRSEHATANAIDIAGFRLADGTRISVNRDWQGDDAKARFLRAVHAGACTYFRVALSPDFNASHRDHFHFDRGFLWRCY